MKLIIYAGEKPIYISNKPDETLIKLSRQDNVVCSDNEKNPDVLKIIEQLGGKKKVAAVITGKNFTVLKNLFIKPFEVIEAAGGIVQNNERDILFIFRKGKWDLPKGKMESGESPEVCAEREIEEETGVKDLTLKRKVGDTYHLYRENGKDILKISRWFYFTCSSEQILQPQPEEDITEVKWIPTLSIKEPMANTYKTIRDIMTIYFDTP